MSSEPASFEAPKPSESVKRTADASASDTPAPSSSVDSERPAVLSVPPAFVEEFFSAGDRVESLSELSEPLDDDALASADDANRRAAPDVVHRRARFVRYVTWTVLVSVGVCLFALAGAMQRSPSERAVTATEHAPPAESSHVAVESARQPEPTTPPLEAPAPSTSATPIHVASDAPDLGASASAARAAPPSPSSSSVAVEAQPAATINAKVEKARALKLLEGQQIAAAIAAAKRSVAVDATDGEAWLILGAAYQESGNPTEARRAYAMCVKHANGGPGNECTKLLP